MKPISRLRMRARSEKERSATCLLLNRYLPSLGVSSSPRIDSSVVLPQPEGPAIDTYSPLRISMWMPDSAWVSTSSVMNTLTTPSSWISDSDVAVIVPPNLSRRRSGGRRRALVQSDLLEAILRRGVRQDHLVAGLQSLDDLDGVDRHAADLDGSPGRGLAILVELEQLDLAVRRPEARAADEEHVLQPLDLDRAVHREVRTGALRQLAVEGDVDDHRAVLHRRRDAHDVAADQAVAGVDRGPQAELDVLGLHLGDVQLGLELLGPGDARQHRAGGHLLAHLHRQLLEHAGDAGPHLERIHLVLSQLVERRVLFDPGALGGELGGGRALVLLVALLFDRRLLDELLGLEGRQLLRDVRQQPLLEQLEIRLRLELRLLALRFHQGHLRLLAEDLAVELGL